MRVTHVWSDTSSSTSGDQNGMTRSPASLLLTHHDDREGTWNRGAAAAAAPRRRSGLARRRRWRQCDFGGHREEMPRLAVERDRPGAIRRPCFQILFDLKT